MNAEQRAIVAVRARVVRGSEEPVIENQWDGFDLPSRATGRLIRVAAENGEVHVYGFDSDEPLSCGWSVRFDPFTPVEVMSATVNRALDS